MALLRQAAYLLVMCWLLIAHVRADGQSDILNDFFAVLNGDFDNTEQVQKEGTGFDFIQLKVIPVAVPALFGARVLYDEWAFNGDLLNMCLNVITVGENGVVYVAVHNFTDPSQYKPGQFDIAALSNLTADQIQEQKDCVGAFIPSGSGAFEGTWPDCRHYIKKKHPEYVDDLTCTSTNVVVPLTVDEKPELVPYELKLKGKKYPLIGAPDDYVGPCGKIE